MRFRAVLELHGKTATGFVVPPEVVTGLGSHRRPPVQVTIGGYTYRTTVAPMRGPSGEMRSMVPLSAENRAGAGITAGDTVEVDIELDTETRDTPLPDGLVAALQPYPDARAYFDGLAASHRKEWVRWIEEAKKAETRDAGREGGRRAPRPPPPALTPRHPRPGTDRNTRRPTGRGGRWVARCRWVGCGGYRAKAMAIPPGAVVAPLDRRRG